MAFAGDNVLVGYPGGRLVAVALSNGAVRWETAVSEPKGTTEVERLADVLGPIAVADGLACAASFQGRVSCADAASGSLRWARDMSAGGGVARLLPFVRWTTVEKGTAPKREAAAPASKKRRSLPGRWLPGSARPPTGSSRSGPTCRFFI